MKGVVRDIGWRHVSSAGLTEPIANSITIEKAAATHIAAAANFYYTVKDFMCVIMYLSEFIAHTNRQCETVPVEIQRALFQRIFAIYG